LALLTAFLTTRPVSAHALGAECKIRGDKVEVEAYYDDDTPARDARVTVLDKQESVVAEGRTDDQGRWSFPTPKPGRYQVIVDAGGGHLTKLRMTVPDQGHSVGAAVSSSAEGCPCCEGSPNLSGDEADTISDGPTREEFTRFPWSKAAIGLGILGGLALVLRLARRADRALSNHPSSPGESGQSHRESNSLHPSKEGTSP
jgi:hypothetical protein